MGKVIDIKEPEQENDDRERRRHEVGVATDIALRDLIVNQFHTSGDNMDDTTDLVIDRLRHICDDCGTTLFRLAEVAIEEQERAGAQEGNG